MNLRHPSFILFLALLLLSSCSSRPLYQPTAVVSPMFTQKGEVDVGINIHSGEMFNVHGAYSVTENIAVLASLGGLGTTTEDSGDNSIIKENNNSWGFAAGYFTKMKNKEKGHFEVFAGYDHFKESYDYTLADTFSTLNELQYNRFFVQPSFYKSGEVADLGLASRFSYLSYTNTFGGTDIPTVRQGYGSDVFMELILTSRIGYKSFRFTTQFGPTFRLSNNSTLDNPIFYGSFGISLHFSKRWNE